MSEKRDGDVVGDAFRNQEARGFVFLGDRLLLKAEDSGPIALFETATLQTFECDPASAVLLGIDHQVGGRPILASAAPSSMSEAPEGYFAVDLRSLAAQGLIPFDQLGAVAQARSVLGWHQTHRFCANCGTETTSAAGGLRRDCPTCERQHFPRVDPVVIMLAIDGDRCLMGRQKRFAEGMYSCLAGFVEPGETAENAVRRETFEEAGIRIGDVRYVASQPWPFVSSLMLGFHADAKDTEITMDEDELEDCRWFSREEVGQMLEATHPEGLFCPPEMAIAHTIVRAFMDG